MSNDKNAKTTNKFADITRDKSFLTQKDKNFLSNERFLYCDPPEVILQSNSFIYF
jgi:hypothetical protein